MFITYQNNLSNKSIVKKNKNQCILLFVLPSDLKQIFYIYHRETLFYNFTYICARNLFTLVIIYITYSIIFKLCIKQIYIFVFIFIGFHYLHCNVLKRVVERYFIIHQICRDIIQSLFDNIQIEETVMSGYVLKLLIIFE